MKRLPQMAIGLVLVSLGIGGAKLLVSMRSAAARKPVEATVPAVRVVKVKAAQVPAAISANGTAMPALDVTIQPEVTGRIVYMSKALVPGGRFKKGETLARVDARDYALVIRQQESQVHKAELQLKLEAGRQKIAKREWDLLGGDPSSSDLALRKPHLAVAKYEVDATKSGLERAKLNLERTTLRAPFNAIVMTETLEVGQLVGPNTRAARLIGTDHLWVRLSVPVERLPMIDIPGVNAEIGSDVEIVQNLGEDTEIRRKGQVTRLLAELDHQTRTAQLLVTVDKPFDDENGGAPLLPSAYVTVHITGRKVEGVFAVPRAAVRNGDQVWIVTAEGKLALRQVKPMWGSSGRVFVQGELQDGDQVVTTVLSLPIEGMAVRIEGDS